MWQVVSPARSSQHEACPRCHHLAFAHSVFFRHTLLLAISDFFQTLIVSVISRYDLSAVSGTDVRQDWREVTRESQHIAVMKSKV
jgi:hypothetical protein